MPDVPKIWPKDRLSDDHTVSDAIHNAVLAERKRLTKEYLSAIAFEAGKSYLVFVSREHVDARAIEEICSQPCERDYTCTFVFAQVPFDGSIRDVVTSVEVNPDSVIFVSEDALPEDLKIEGVTINRIKVPPNRTVASVVSRDLMAAERERADYADHRLMKAWRIAVGDDPEAEFDTNNFYDLIREGAEAKKKLAEGDQAVKEFLAGRIDEALVEFDVTLAQVNIAVERCAKIAEEFVPDTRIGSSVPDPHWVGAQIARRIRSEK